MAVFKPLIFSALFIVSVRFISSFVVFYSAKVANKNVTTKFSSSESREKLVFTMLSREIILTKVEF